MSTLAKIEAALPALNAEELAHLEVTLRTFRAEHRAPSDLSEFAGRLQATEESLTFQRQMREEWE